MQVHRIDSVTSASIAVALGLHNAHCMQFVSLPDSMTIPLEGMCFANATC